MAGARKALVVGVNQYEEQAAIPELKGAEKDAEEMRNLLTEYGEFDVRLLLGPQATYSEVRGEISDLLWQTDSRDLTLFYFSGHGFKDSYGTGYLAPWDMRKARPLVHGIEMQALRRLALASANKDAVVLIFDCCFAGLAAEEGPKGSKGSAEAADAIEKCFSDLVEVQQAKEKGKGVFVFASSSRDETSRELSDCRHKLGKDDAHHHGAFTFHLIEGLMGEAAEREGGEISVAGLRNHVEQASCPYEVYQTRAAHPRDIVLARVTGLGALDETLKRIEGNLGSEDMRDVIVAASELARVLADRPNYAPAKALRPKAQNGLGRCRQVGLAWLRKNKLDLLQQGFRASDDLEDLLCELSLERIEAERQNQRELMNSLTYVLRAIKDGWSISRLLTSLGIMAPTPTRTPSKLDMGIGGNQ